MDTDDLGLVRSPRLVHHHQEGGEESYFRGEYSSAPPRLTVVSASFPVLPCPCPAPAPQAVARWTSFSFSCSQPVSSPLLWKHLRFTDPVPAPQLRSVPSPAFSEELRRNCRERLLACLADLTVQTTLIKGMLLIVSGGVHACRDADMRGQRTRNHPRLPPWR